MKNKKIFVTREIPITGIRLLQQEGFTVKIFPHDRPMTGEELIAEGREANALLCISTDNIGMEFITACNHLDIISQFAAGFDNIHLETASKFRIPVGYAPGAMSDATADIAFGLMIAVSRKMFYMHKTISRGEWKHFRPMANLGVELKNKTLGIFGLGRIGMEMAIRCKGAYQMKIVYCNRTANREAEEKLGAVKLSFAELLAQSDVLSVHCSLSQETRGLFNRDAFLQMKPGSIFINTSRGAVHHEKDLIDALKSGVIWGAGLDVTNPEPMDPDNPLLSMENVAILPHIGSATIEARSEMSRMAAVNIIEFYKNGKIPHLLNPEVLNNK